MPPPRSRRPLAPFAVAFLAAAAAPLAGQDSGPAPAPAKPPRSESNLSIGPMIGGVIGIVKGFAYYVVPEYVTVDLDFQYIGKELPLGTNVALNLPLGRIRPFVTAGAAVSLRGSTILDAGGGVKVRVSKGISVLAEYRYYRYRHAPAGALVGSDEKAELFDLHYIGAGISYLY